MRKILTLSLFVFIIQMCYSQEEFGENRWAINSIGGITWKIDSLGISLRDHIEMSVDLISVVLCYGVD
jgi:hypothetical protein